MNFLFFANLFLSGMMYMNMQSKGLMFAVYTALLWGFLAIGLEVTFGWVDSITVVWVRFVVAFMILSIWLLITGRKSFSIFRKPPPLIFVAAIFLGLNYFGFMEGLHNTSPSNAQIFIQLGPVTFALVGIFIYKEKVTWRSYAGLALVLSGLFLFYYNQLPGLRGMEGEYKKGITLIIAGAFCWAAFASFQKKLVSKWDANQLNLMIYAICSLLFLPAADFSKLIQLNFGQWLLLISLGLNTVLSYGFLAVAIKYADANKVSVVITLNPIITFVTMTILGLMHVSWIDPENFNVYSIIGAFVALAGAIMTILSRNKNTQGI